MFKGCNIRYITGPNYHWVGEMKYLVRGETWNSTLGSSGAPYQNKLYESPSLTTYTTTKGSFIYKGPFYYFSNTTNDQSYLNITSISISNDFLLTYKDIDRKTTYEILFTSSANKASAFVAAKL